jgi:hypothetical protein
MRSPAAAIAWEFRRRHRWGLIALAAYLAVLAMIKVLVPEPARTFNMDSGERFAVVVMGPLTTTFLYVLTVFSFGLSGDVAGRQSMYPARMFTLPVSTTALTLWPMLYGAATMALLWLATRFLAIWPTGFDIPTIWPALAAVSLLAWTQTLTWMPHGLPGLRMVLAVLWLSTMDSIVLLALHYHASEAVMVAIVAPQIPLAYVAARFAVARARRGDVPDWSGALRTARGARVTQARKPFRSAASAQAWFEWRLGGTSLPVWVAIVLPFELLLLWTAGGSRMLVFEYLLIVFLTPIILATFAAATVSKPGVNAGDSYGLAPFLATRPLSGAQLVTAKLRATLASAALAWLFVIVAVPLALAWSGEMPLVLERSRRFAQAVGTPRAVVFLLLVLGAFIASTWKQLVQTLYIGLTGRAWLVKGSIFVTVTFLILVGPTAEWVVETGRLRWVWNALPLIFTLLVCVKMSGAVWVATRLHRSRLVSDRALVVGAACWCGAVFALYGVLAWMLDTPHVPHYLLTLLAILAIPLVRLSVAPLALDWNRHR